MECEKFIKTKRNRYKHVVVLIVLIRFEFKIQCGDDIRNIFDLELNTNILLLIHLNLLDVLRKEFSIKVPVIHYR